MKKNVVQDVVPPKKSIRNVTIPGRTSAPLHSVPERAIPASKHIQEDSEFTRPVPIKQAPIRIEPVSPPPPINRDTIPTYKYEMEEPPKKKGKKWLYVAVGFFVLVIAFGVSAFFKSAVIRVTPKQDVLVLNETFRAVKDAVSGNLPFQVVTVSKSVEKSVPATGEAQVQKKAQGRIIVYNETTQTQKLVATTRFETPEGLIFRLPVGITIPAGQIKDGKIIAGTVETTVEADKVGAIYNVGLKDFTLPGLKGDPKFKTIYGRSKTEMTGGFSGLQKIVSKENIDGAESELSSQLKDSLAKDIVTQIPANFVLYTGGLTYKLDATEQVSSGAETATLRKKGTVYAVIFDKTLLTKSILAKGAPAVSADTIRITNLESLEFSYTVGTTFNPNTDTSLNFSLKGSPNLEWVIDENKLKTDLLGLSRAKAKIVLATYDTIKEAWVETHPFWNQTIPADPNKVTLVNTLTK